MRFELLLTLGSVRWTITCHRPSNKAAIANGLRILRHRRLNNEPIEVQILTIDGKAV
jgi:hypothetical protein